MSNQQAKQPKHQLKIQTLKKSIKTEDKKENQPNIISISTTFNKSPVSDVEIYLQTNAKYIFVCRTNEQGKMSFSFTKFRKLHNHSKKLDIQIIH